MDTNDVQYRAYFTDPDAAPGSDESETEMRVESWSADGLALVLDQEEGRLVSAKERPGFLRVERHDEPQVRGVIPGAGWKLGQKDGLSLGTPVVAFLVYDGYVRPITGLPPTGTGRVSRETHQLVQHRE
ncbi:hypothetical protein G3I60_02935 [Streptomyces sp. SID13666]|uniref:hypothetical protein n=1 Tax=Streptomyces TaxID=1883 RepID=UPI001106ABCE|nr:MULTISPECIES: hypothetical protein [Streptomyces]MCZ4099692.1 hypothetical protein [Streptomyces sp. H39-C1]NEA53155.1 hypothetical protein [Streptomyces sp. SID13666]NEA69518.1 hypothetical protein [Streptomyces sp. SID13588]QNA70947.1 hypothetical protein C8250_002470 [Streptomyces sp. So13.3]